MDLYAVLFELVSERKRLDRLIQIVEDLGNHKGSSSNINLSSRTEGPRRGRKSMGQEERALVSRRMKKYWAARKQVRAETNDSAEGGGTGK